MHPLTYEDLDILVIDDDPFILDIIALSLNNIGIDRISTATNGREALALLDSPDTGFNLLLCDLNMPEMDGVELLRHIADRQYTGNIIILSAEDLTILNTVKNLAQKLKLNILGAVEKPLDINQFKTLLESTKTVPSKTSTVPTNKIETPIFSADDVAKGIEQKQFILHYQPQALAISKKIVGFEALSRWQHPIYGILSPTHFIKVAQDNHLIDKISFQLFDRLVSDVSYLKEVIDDFDYTFSFNLPASLLSKLDLPEYFEKQIATYALSPQQFIIEITESQLINHIEAALEITSRLRLKRFGISIDDFGTGFSSMQQLEQIPFTELKIDRAFVHNISNKPIAKAILKTSIELAKTLKIATVAEGVETEKDWQTAQSAGADIIQGYFFSKPIPVNKIIHLLK